MKKSIAQIRIELHKAEGGNVPSGPPPDIAQQLERLKEQMRQQMAANTTPTDQKTKEWQESAAFKRIFPRAKGGRVTHAHHLEIEERSL
jgi:hypothetical protein